MPRNRLNIPVTDDELKEIGILAFHWGFLEEIVDMTIWYYAGVARRDRRKLTSNMDFSHKIDKLRALAAEKAATENELNTLTTLTRDALRVANERHKYMHGRWGFTHRGKRMLFTFRKSKSPKGHAESITLAKIEKAVDDTAKVIRGFQTFLENQ